MGSKARVVAGLVAVLVLGLGVGAAPATRDGSEDHNTRAPSQGAPETGHAPSDDPGLASRHRAVAKEPAVSVSEAGVPERRPSDSSRPRVDAGGVEVADAMASGAGAEGTPGPVLDAGFEHGLDNWNTGGVGEVIPRVIDTDSRTGTHCGDFKLVEGEERSELILGGNGSSKGGTYEFKEGDDYYYAFSFKVLTMVYGHPGAHNLIMQFKSNGTGGPSLGLQLWDYAGDRPGEGGKGLWSTGGGAMGVKDRFLAPVSERRWHDVMIHFVASEAGEGSYEIYLDGALVDSKSGVDTIVPGRGGAYIKNGLYRNGEAIPGTSEILIDSARLGTTPESVTG